MALNWCSGLHWLPIGVVVILPLTFIATYAIAVYKDHVEPDFPYISDTGALPPESNIFSQFVNISAVLIGAIAYVRYKQIEETYDYVPTRNFARLNKTSFTMCVMAAFGISIVGNFQEQDVLPVHLVGALMAFGMGIIFCWINSYFSYKLCGHLNGRGMVFLRIGLSIASTICFFVTFVLDGYARHLFHGENKRKWFPHDGGFVYHVISAAAEWTMAICFLAYFLTLAPEFKKLSLAPLKLVHRQASYTDEVARCIESDDERDVIA